MEHVVKRKTLTIAPFKLTSAVKQQKKRRFLKQTFFVWMTLTQQSSVQIITKAEGFFSREYGLYGFFFTLFDRFAFLSRVAHICLYSTVYEVYASSY